MKKKNSGLEQIWDGRWYDIHDITTVACCDCGLSHSYRWRMRDGRVQVRLERIPESTAALRRHFKHEFPKA